MRGALVIEFGLLLIRQWSWLHGYAATGVDRSTVEQM